VLRKDPEEVDLSGSPQHATFQMTFERTGVSSQPPGNGIQFFCIVMGLASVGDR
jgi:hypothetical protein